MTASGQLSRPPAGTFVTAYGQSLVSVVSRSTPVHNTESQTISATELHHSMGHYCRDRGADHRRTHPQPITRVGPNQNSTAGPNGVVILR